jgi:ribose transport system substrate-binding protein
MQLTYKSFAPVLAGAAVLALLSGCSHSGGGSTTIVSTTGSAPAAGGATEVAFVTNNASDYWTIARKGTEAATKDDPSITVDFVMPDDGTAATQKADVEAILAKGAKAIAISPVDPKNQTPWLNEIAAKVPLITQDSDAPGSNRLMYLGTDNHEAGIEAGGLIKAALPQGGKIELFVGKRDAQNAKDREQGIRDALKGSNITIVDVRTDDTDHARAKSNAADALVKEPDLAAEVGLWSYNGPAILSAIQDSGKVGKVKIICFDEEKATLAGIKSGAIYGTIVQQPYEFGHQGVKILKELANGDKHSIPASGTDFIPTQAIQQANVDAYIAKMTKLRGE